MYQPKLYTENMGTKFYKKTYDNNFQKLIINDYLVLNSIREVAKKNNITTRQVINILNDNKISHFRKRKIQVDEYYFDKNHDMIIGSDVMYWAGFIAADGNVMNKKENRNYFLTIRLSSKDKDHLEKFKISLNTNAKIKDEFHKEKYVLGKFFKKTSSSTIVINSQYLVNSLAKYNIVPNKSLIYEFPNQLINHKFISSFIRGYFDGDGSISIKNDRLRINFYGTQNCMNTISSIVSNNCQIKLHNSHSNRNIYTIEYSGKEAIQLINWMYNNAHTYLNRKYDLSKLAKQLDNPTASQVS